MKDTKIHVDSSEVKQRLSTIRRTPWTPYVTDVDRITSHIYRGQGTTGDPYIIDWLENDAENPLNWPKVYKWFITISVAVSVLAVTFCSSAFSGGAEEIIAEFGISTEVFVLGISLFVLGFAVGPLLWAPFSEMLGRRALFIITYAFLVAFNAGAAGSQNIQTLIILRAFAGIFGSSPLTNVGGTLADLFVASQRGLALSFFAAAPFMGPVIGPIVGGFVGETVGWRWIEGVMAIFTAVMWIIGTVFIPETYAPVLLRKRAQKLSRLNGAVYKSKFDAQKNISFAQLLKTSLSRPWALLFREPAVLLLSMYMALIYGILYMLFAAFPIVYQQGYHWSAGIGGLAFCGIAIGMIGAVIYTIPDNRRYERVEEENGGRAPPEARLPPACVGSFAIPIGLFWFAWTNDPSIHYLASIAAGIPFGFGMVLVFVSIFNYLIDAYVIYAASVLAANSVLRSVFGAAFPLFTTQMYNNLGIHWASSIPAFLSVACLPFPFIFYKYGRVVRKHSKFAAEAQKFVDMMTRRMSVISNAKVIVQEEATVVALGDKRVVQLNENVLPPPLISNGTDSAHI